MGNYLRPGSLSEATEALSARRFSILAGGTDFFPARVGNAVDEDILDVTSIPELRGISEEEAGWRIGAAVTWSEGAQASLPRYFACLQLAAREIGGGRIQNAGTLAGNLCNASPAADGVPALLALDARVELASKGGRRELPLSRFITGSRQTARSADEIVTAVRVPRRGPHARSAFLKLGARKYLVISIAMAAALVDCDADGRIEGCAFVVGACTPVAVRLPALEARLTGTTLAAGLAEGVSVEDLAPLAPIDDVRGSAAYRLDAASTLLRRLIVALAHE